MVSVMIAPPAFIQASPPDPLSSYEERGNAVVGCAPPPRFAGMGLGGEAEQRGLGGEAECGKGGYVVVRHSIGIPPFVVRQAVRQVRRVAFVNSWSGERKVTLVPGAVARRPSAP